jgi:N-dimethylarginine dimethylaminohydrolase
MSSQYDGEYVRTILMGDPAHFSVQGGANPHTRTRWGTKRLVDRERAIEQWRGLKAKLQEAGIRVIVVPPDPIQPGLVYPANAGFQSHLDAAKPLAEKRFTLSNLLPTRAGEKAHYRRVLLEHGCPICELAPPATEGYGDSTKGSKNSDSLRFEGEADFFPAGDLFLLTCGRLEQQRFVPSFGIPPWKRVYGFRTDARVADILAPQVAPTRILRIQLVLEAHYHGDTALCAFGSGREHLLAYRRAMRPEDWSQLADHFDDRLIELEEADATHYAANSFSYTPNSSQGESFLFMPDGLSDRLLGQIRERGVTPISVDVSEFLKKGGGSVKCMIGDLGLVAEGDLAES